MIPQPILRMLNNEDRDTRVLALYLISSHVEITEKLVKEVMECPDCLIEEVNNELLISKIC